VSQPVLAGEKEAGSIPERRPAKEERIKMTKEKADKADQKKLSYPVWRCKVCGYLCAWDNPPEVCPICKVTKERFEKFME
jgi:ferredoxin-thioredoxin reductase catalytic chain